MISGLFFSLQRLCPPLISSTSATCCYHTVHGDLVKSHTSISLSRLSLLPPVPPGWPAARWHSCRSICQHREPPVLIWLDHYQPNGKPDPRHVWGKSILASSLLF
ncbi:hypothetical protein BDZ97DRAFT_2074937 [Flammula alnicola]|nr:hypothetical protein BDZ97DRAFT_2074937 [Flammula alnicola]